MASCDPNALASWFWLEIVLTQNDRVKSGFVSGDTRSVLLLEMLFII